ncbi:hypothetical protein OV079_22395 [Nannocystis pusilla]|uniref:Uncharacterized protein n=1 Tax=Nannocystis pusilla TaxID=889268 RepID=A0A9X3ERW7_9BACT|nr:hypothetical protein [Nannocystis pusilla]MCY1008259.1 hypothetical protein [Nannocystis pusilla]
MTDEHVGDGALVGPVDDDAVLVVGVAVFGDPVALDDDAGERAVLAVLGVQLDPPRSVGADHVVDDGDVAAAGEVDAVVLVTLGAAAAEPLDQAGLDAQALGVVALDVAAVLAGLAVAGEGDVVDGDVLDGLDAGGVEGAGLGEAADVEGQVAEDDVAALLGEGDAAAQAHAVAALADEHDRRVGRAAAHDVEQRIFAGVVAVVDEVTGAGAVVGELALAAGGGAELVDGGQIDAVGAVGAGAGEVGPLADGDVLGLVAGGAGRRVGVGGAGRRGRGRGRRGGGAVGRGAAGGAVRGGGAAAVAALAAAGGVAGGAGAVTRGLAASRLEGQQERQREGELRRRHGAEHRRIVMPEWAHGRAGTMSTPRDRSAPRGPVGFDPPDARRIGERTGWSGRVVRGPRARSLARAAESTWSGEHA